MKGLQYALPIIWKNEERFTLWLSCFMFEVYAALFKKTYENNVEWGRIKLNFARIIHVHITRPLLTDGSGLTERPERQRVGVGGRDGRDGSEWNTTERWKKLDWGHKNCPQHSVILLDLDACSSAFLFLLALLMTWHISLKMCPVLFMKCLV